jgi:hypothetical protein
MKFLDLYFFEITRPGRWSLYVFPFSMRPFVWVRWEERP